LVRWHPGRNAKRRIVETAKIEFVLSPRGGKPGPELLVRTKCQA
jgi:hypothetical protein